MLVEGKTLTILSIYCIIVPFVYFLAAPSMEYFSAPLFHLIFAFGGFVYSIVVSISRYYQGPCKKEAVDFFVDWKDLILRNFTLGILFGAIPNMLFWHSLKYFQISEASSLMVCGAFVSVIYQIRMRVPFYDGDYFVGGFLVTGLAFTTFYVLAMRVTQLGFTNIILPFSEVVIASIIVGFSPFAHDIEPVGELIQNASHTGFCLIWSLILNGVSGICEKSQTAPCKAWLSVLIGGAIYGGLGLSARREMLADDRSYIVFGCLVVGQAVIANSIGIVLFGEYEPTGFPLVVRCIGIVFLGFSWVMAMACEEEGTRKPKLHVKGRDRRDYELIPDVGADSTYNREDNDLQL